MEATPEQKEEFRRMHKLRQMTVVLMEGDPLFLSVGRYTRGVKVIRIGELYCVLPYRKDLYYSEHTDPEDAILRAHDITGLDV